MRRLPRASGGFWTRLWTGLFMLVSGLVLCAFSLVMVGVFAIAGGVIWLWVLWRTRDLRRSLRAQAKAAAMNSRATSGTVIEGEFVQIVPPAPDRAGRRR